MQTDIQPKSQTKTCSRCRQSLPVTIFSKNKARKDGLDALCRACIRSRNQEQYAKHAEKRRAYAIAYAAAHAEEKSAYNQEYRAKNASEINAYLKEWRKNNKASRSAESREVAKKRERDKYRNDPAYRARLLAARAAYREANKDKIQAANKAARKARTATAPTAEDASEEKRINRMIFKLFYYSDKGRAYYKQYRPIANASARASYGQATQAHIIHLHKWQENHCYYCNAKMTTTTVEHVIPVSRNGSGNDYNVVLACPTCNFSKQDRLFGLEWLPETVHAIPRAWSPLVSVLADGGDIDRDQGILTKNGIQVCVLSSFWASERGGPDSQEIIWKYRNQGVFVFWDYEVEHHLDAVKNVLSAKWRDAERTFARKTIVEQVHLSEIRDFLTKYHMQGAGNASLCLALKDSSGRIVGAATFVEKDKQYDLSRLAFVGHVPGGMSRLLSKFGTIRKFDKPLFSYADLRFGTGAAYEKNGFARLGETGIPYGYVTPTGMKHRLAVSKMALSLMKESDFFDASLPEVAIANTNGIFRFFGVPHARFIWG